MPHKETVLKRTILTSFYSNECTGPLYSKNICNCYTYLYTIPCVFRLLSRVTDLYNLQHIMKFTLYLGRQNKITKWRHSHNPHVASSASLYSQVSGQKEGPSEKKELWGCKEFQNRQAFLSFGTSQAQPQLKLTVILLTCYIPLLTINLKKIFTHFIYHSPFIFARTPMKCGILSHLCSLSN